MDTYACTDHPKQSRGVVRANVEERGEINRMRKGVCGCLHDCKSAGGVSVSTSSAGQKELTASGLPQHGGRDALPPLVISHFIHQSLAHAIFSPSTCPLSLFVTLAVSLYRFALCTVPSLLRFTVVWQSSL